LLDTAEKIPLRIKTFKEIRAAVTNYQEFPTEDIETTLFRCTALPILGIRRF
jgi:hypothetical protein